MLGAWRWLSGSLHRSEPASWRLMKPRHLPAPLRSLSIAALLTFARLQAVPLPVCTCGSCMGCWECAGMLICNCCFARRAMHLLALVRQLLAYCCLDGAGRYP